MLFSPSTDHSTTLSAFRGGMRISRLHRGRRLEPLLIAQLKGSFAATKGHGQGTHFLYFESLFVRQFTKLDALVRYPALLSQSTMEATI